MEENGREIQWNGLARAPKIGFSSTMAFEAFVSPSASLLHG